MKRAASREPYRIATVIVLLLVASLAIVAGLYHGCHTEASEAPEPHGVSESVSGPYPTGS